MSPADAFLVGAALLIIWYIVLPVIGIGMFAGGIWLYLKLRLHRSKKDINSQ